MPTELLNNIYNEITIEDQASLKTEFDSIIFTYVNDFLAKYESADYPEIIYQYSHDIPAIKIGCLLDICIWSSSDNGSRQGKILNQWILGDDERKIEIALNVSNVYPLNDYEELIQRLDEIQTQYPQLITLCQFWKSASTNLKKHKPKQMKKLDIKTISTEQLQTKEKSLKLFIGIFIPLIIGLSYFVVRDYNNGGDFDWPGAVILLCTIFGGPVYLYPKLRAIQQELSSRAN